MYSLTLPLVCPVLSSISLWNLKNDKLIHCETWRGHSQLYNKDTEVWITAYDYYNTNIIFSGGDDTTLRGWDIRTPLYTTTDDIKKRNLLLNLYYILLSLNTNFFFQNFFFQNFFFKFFFFKIFFSKIFFFHFFFIKTN